MKQVEIQLIRNATLKINYNGKCFIVDPMFASKHSFMSFVNPAQTLNPTVDLPMQVEDIVNGVDAILLTHSHPDHIDSIAIELLNKNLPLFAQEADREFLGGTDFQNITYINKELIWEGIEIYRTDGVHGPEDIRGVIGKVSGFVLKAKDCPTVYIVGDCLLDQTIADNIKKHNPDIIITNSGGAYFRGGSHRILMNQEDTLAMAEENSNCKIVAVHLESIDHCPVSRDELRQSAKDKNLNIYAPDDGEILRF